MIVRLMSWCVPDEALHRKRVPSMIESAEEFLRVLREDTADPGLEVHLRYHHPVVVVPGSWFVGKEG